MILFFQNKFMHPWSIPHCVRSIFSEADCRYVGHIMRALRARLGVARLLLANADSDSRSSVSIVQAKDTLDLLQRHNDELLTTKLKHTKNITKIGTATSSTKRSIRPT